MEKMDIKKGCFFLEKKIIKIKKKKNHNKMSGPARARNSKPRKTTRDVIYRAAKCVGELDLKWNGAEMGRLSAGNRALLEGILLCFDRDPGDLVWCFAHLQVFCAWLAATISWESPWGHLRSFGEARDTLDKIMKGDSWNEPVFFVDISKSDWDEFPLILIDPNEYVSLRQKALSAASFSPIEMDFEAKNTLEPFFIWYYLQHVEPPPPDTVRDTYGLAEIKNMAVVSTWIGVDPIMISCVTHIDINSELCDRFLEILAELHIGQSASDWEAWVEREVECVKKILAITESRSRNGTK